MSDTESPSPETDVETRRPDNKTLSVTIPLDGTHKEIVDELTARGVDVNTLVADECRPNVEETLYNVFQQLKYNE